MRLNKELKPQFGCAVGYEVIRRCVLRPLFGLAYRRKAAPNLGRPPRSIVGPARSV